MYQSGIKHRQTNIQVLLNTENLPMYQLRIKHRQTNIQVLLNIVNLPMYHSGIKHRQTNMQVLLNIVSLCNKPCSSTNPLSWSDFPQEGWEQVKCPGHQVRPRAVMNGPLAIKSNFFC